MKKKQVLCICSSVYQTIAITQIIKCFYSNYSVDIILTNYMKDYETIANGFREESFCKNVYAINVDNIRYNIDCCVSECAELFTETYDEVLIHSFNNVCTYFINSIEEQLGINVDISLYEDGLATYSKIYERYYTNAPLRLKQIKQIYAFEPKYFDWSPACKITRIPKLSYSDYELIKLLNGVFKYNKHDIDCMPIIYVESIANIYGYDSQEEEYLFKIITQVGRDKIGIKRHPRNLNRKISGVYNLDNNLQFIPFELLLLNQDIKDKVLLTISSNGVYSAATMFDIPVTAVSLLKCMDNRPFMIEQELRYCIEKIHKENSNYFYMAENIQDAIDYLKRRLAIK